MDLGTLHGYIAERHDNICALEAQKDGKTLYSDCWHGFAPTDAVNVMSVTKSVTSLLIGVALDRGLIEDIRQPVLDFFPDYTVKRGEKTIRQVTLAHLMGMTAPYKYRYEPWSRVCSSDDWTKAALDLLGGRGGVTGAYRYSTLGVQILMGVIAKTAGMPTIAFANRFLFEPIGIASHRNFEAETVEAHKEFTLSKQPRENVWFADPQGVNTAGWGLCMSARDMARLGQLCLNGGMYDGKRIVSSQWIARIVKPRQFCGEQYGNMSYGYMWWIPNAKEPAYAAIGNGGNVLYVNPANGVVVAIGASFNPRVFDRIEFIQRIVEPLLEERSEA